MLNTPEIVEWFRRDPLPGILRYPTIVLGGQYLLREFMNCVGRWNGDGKLCVSAPYVTAGAFDAGGTWDILSHWKMSLQIVTRSQRAANVVRDRLSGFTWKSLEIGVCRALHSKIYAFIRDTGDCACLIGSHNLSTAALRRNDEAGVLFISNGNDTIASVVSTWCHYIESLLSTADIVTDRHRIRSETV